jgi:hypothetical protein
MAKSL